MTTIGEIQDALIASGRQFDRVVTADDSKIKRNRDYELQVGDQVYATDNGKPYRTSVTDDAGTLADWKPSSASGAANSAKGKYNPTTKELADDPVAAWSKAIDRAQAAGDLEEVPSLTNELQQAQARADTKARQQQTDKKAQDKEDKTTNDAADKERRAATRAVQKISARLSGTKSVPALTPEEEDAYNHLVLGVGGPRGGYSLPIANYKGEIAEHWGGNKNGAVDFAASPTTPVLAITSGKVVMSNPAYGSAGATVVIQGDDGKMYMYQDLEPGNMPDVGRKLKTGEAFSYPAAEVGPGVRSSGPHVHVAITDATTGMKGFETNAGTSTNFDTLGFLQGIASGKMPAGGTGGLSSGIVNPYAIPSATEPKTPTFHWDTHGRVFVQRPDGTVAQIADFGDLDMPTHITTKSGGRDVVLTWDPKTKSLQTSWIGEPDLSQTPMGKIQSMFDQYGTSQQAIINAYRQGTITQQQMMDYTQHLQSYVEASLQGTTPFERMKFQQEQATLRTSTAKDLLNKQVEVTTKTASDMLQNSMSLLGQKKYSGIDLAPDTLFDIYKGGLDSARRETQPLSDLANKLLAGFGTQALSAGLDPRTDVLTGQAPASTLPTLPGTGPYAQTLRPQPNDPESDAALRAGIPAGAIQ